MANKQIHELPAGERAGARRTSSSSRRRAATSPGAPASATCRSRRALPGTSRRTIAGKLGEMVSVKDFGAVGDGSADDSAAFQAALDQHTAVHVPAGTYRLDGEIQVKPRRRLFGAGRDATVIDARGAARVHLQPQRRRLPGRRPRRQRLVPQLGLRGMTIRMATGGIRAHGHEFRGHRSAVRRRCRRRRAWPTRTAGASTWSTPTNRRARGSRPAMAAAAAHRAARQRHPPGARPSPAVNYGDSLLAGDLDQARGRATPAACCSLGNHPG